MTREEIDRELMYLKSTTNQEDTIAAIQWARHLVTLAPPRKVRYDYDGFSDGLPVYDMAYCPNCDYAYEDGDKDWKLPFCPYCGQALRWEGDDE